MYHHFDLSNFINQHVTGRDKSLLTQDLETYDKQLRERIENRSILVIGGAGTIGSSYIKAILKYKIKKLVVVDINENGLTELVRDLRSSSHLFVPDEIKTYPINFADEVFTKLFNQEGPFEIVANFAAHKHVRSEKDQYSIEAMIKNNVLQAKSLLDLLLTTPPERFFCVSTDKAANPVNIMGASKKLMEDVILAYSSRLHINTARFANVAFSNGSLPLGFLERIAKKQPWSCPLGIRRYFVSPEESGQICMIASILGDSGNIFFPKLDMDNDLKAFSDIANSLLKELGLEPYISPSEDEARAYMSTIKDHPGTYPVYFFESDTSGEKSYEEFYTDTEVLDMDTFAKLGVIRNPERKSIESIESIIDQLSQLFKKKDISKADILLILKQYLPNFEHIEKGKNLDQKM